MKDEFTGMEAYHRVGPPHERSGNGTAFGAAALVSLVVRDVL